MKAIYIHAYKMHIPSLYYLAENIVLTTIFIFHKIVISHHLYHDDSIYCTSLIYL